MGELVGRRGARLLVITVGAGLAVDGYVHLDVAGSYRLVRSAYVSQADLFRVEGVVAIAAGLALLARPGKITALLAMLVGLAGVAAVLLYTCVDPGQIGPLPDMYEPVWYPEKLISFIGEAVAALAGGLLLGVLSARRASGAATTPRGPRAR